MQSRELILENIRKIIREALNSGHSFERFEERFKNTGIDAGADFKIIKLNFNKVENKKFPVSQSFAIMLGDLNVDRNSKNYINVRGKDLYRIYTKDGVASVGNQVWCVVRHNMISTIMLRLDSQTRDNAVAADRMKVDIVIRDINDIEKY